MSRLLSPVLDDANMMDALEQVKHNKGNAGVDGITVDEIDDYLRNNWRTIKEKISQRTYKPAPVLSVKIPKSNGGVRNLG